MQEAVTWGEWLRWQPLPCCLPGSPAWSRWLTCMEQVAHLQDSPSPRPQPCCSWSRSGDQALLGSQGEVDRAGVWGHSPPQRQPRRPLGGDALNIVMPQGRGDGAGREGWTLIVLLPQLGLLGLALPGQPMSPSRSAPVQGGQAREPTGRWHRATGYWEAPRAPHRDPGCHVSMEEGARDPRPQLLESDKHPQAEPVPGGWGGAGLGLCRGDRQGRKTPG